MIFIVLGSQKFQFNRLLKEIDELIDKGIVTDKVFAQIGYSDYLPKNYSFKRFLDRDEFAQMQEKADIVITHGGTGAIIGAVKKGKKVIAVPRLAKYGEHVDNHQIQLLKAFGQMHIIEVCFKLSALGTAIGNARKKTYREFVSNTERFNGSIDKYIRNIRK